MYLMTLTVHLKLVKMVKFYIYFTMIKNANTHVHTHPLFYLRKFQVIRESV